MPTQALQSPSWSPAPLAMDPATRRTLFGVGAGEQRCSGLGDRFDASGFL